MRRLLSLLVLTSVYAFNPVRADECCANTEATVEQRLRDIDLNIAIRMYEQIQTERSKAEVQLVLIETEVELPAPERKERSEQLQKRVDILTAHADRIRSKILKLNKAVSVATR